MIATTVSERNAPLTSSAAQRSRSNFRAALITPHPKQSSHHSDADDHGTNDTCVDTQNNKLQEVDSTFWNVSKFWFRQQDLKHPTQNNNLHDEGAKQEWTTKP